ncbi:cation diffusion facilitator family transporter [Accumulibacter sp.]|uniref:cation diffusion facilitator family transporter n=1 Tax=Accumulibacter sp. TaxID=2053492 RepID=UPI0025E6A95C|nr:cation diffusion facilitator family transporter [Accumulibacter sp.]MCM8612531.1 cation diffusion facilitator family transporter [Accumulibacter sp.]MCM8636438.1 cation diffusion facilitator family transporter [Accumulibacter sp.]MCM8640163.1 cation diffusion facilitator family transporter [Accumulibacter sp.]
MTTDVASRASLTRYAWLSIGAATLTIALKAVAWWLTGSVGLLSDAIESFVNLVGALMALWMLTLAALPADEEHAYGYSKAEYFSSAFEGFLILLAAVSIGYAALVRLLDPQPLAEVGLGLMVSLLASAINLATARILLRVGREHDSISLEADAQHLMTDVWTSAGVIVGVALVWLSGWFWLDPAIALVVAANILWTAFQLMRRSLAGLLDASLSAPELAGIEALLALHRAQGIAFHALRTRRAGSRSFVSLHVLVPGQWTVQQGHDRVERIEDEIRELLPRAHVTTHLEPLEDPLSMSDQDLERRPRSGIASS